MSLRDNTAFRELEQCVRRYCTLIEHGAAGGDGWLRELSGAIARLYSAASQFDHFGLPDDAEDYPDSFTLSYEERMNLAKLLNGGPLRGCDHYFTYFEPTIAKRYTELENPTDALVIGQLWDDLVDIYGDLKPGLLAWDTGRESYLPYVAFSWVEPGFRTHWGLHAVNALRALHWNVFDRD